MQLAALLPTLALSYLIGAIPFALLVGRVLGGVDIQRSGSGNAGANNMLQTAGRLAALLVVVLDGGKAALAMLPGLLAGDIAGATLCGAAAVIGHCFSPFLILRWRGQLRDGWKLALRRSGGKGLASGLVVLLLLAWPVALAVSALFLLGRLAVWRDETWPTIIAVALSAPLAWWWTHSRLAGLSVLVVTLVIIIKHLPDARDPFYIEPPDEQGSPR